MHEDLLRKFEQIPRTKEELDDIRSSFTGDQTEKVLKKAFDHNEKILVARKIAKMMELEEFASFWFQVHNEMEELTDGSVKTIKGDPFSKLDQLSFRQGALELLDSQSIQVEEIKRRAKLELIPTETLEAKLKSLNQ